MAHRTIDTKIVDTSTTMAISLKFYIKLFIFSLQGSGEKASVNSQRIPSQKDGGKNKMLV